MLNSLDLDYFQDAVLPDCAGLGLFFSLVSSLFAPPVPLPGSVDQ